MSCLGHYPTARFQHCLDMQYQLRCIPLVGTRRSKDDGGKREEKEKTLTDVIEPNTPVPTHIPMPRHPSRYNNQIHRVLQCSTCRIRIRKRGDEATSPHSRRGRNLAAVPAPLVAARDSGCLRERGDVKTASAAAVGKGPVPDHGDGAVDDDAAEALLVVVSKPGALFFLKS